ncbi:MAG: zinc metallopeptidase [Oscillospiraceae bacterium]|nr:zinc metallopeptidase [Oscillospiraceae bacterium]
MYGGYYYGVDIWYLVLVIPALLVTLYAQWKVKSTFKEFSGYRIVSGLTGAEAARQVLSANGLNSVLIQPISGELSDNYNPETNTISLSSSVYSVPSIAAAGVAAHEAGHACQYAEDYGPMRFRSAIIPVCNIGAGLSWPAILLGYILGLSFLVFAGIILFSLSVVFQLVTLPVEFNASTRAIESLERCNLMTEDELYGAKKVLRAAALTYVAALAVSIANLLRLILIFGGSNRRRR